MCMNCVREGKMSISEANLMKEALTQMTPTIEALFGPVGVQRHHEIMEELFGSATQDDIDRVTDDIAEANRAGISPQDLNTASSLLRKLVGDQIPADRFSPQDFFGSIFRRPAAASTKAKGYDLPVIPMGELVVITNDQSDFNGTEGKVLWALRDEKRHCYAVEISGMEKPLFVDRGHLVVKTQDTETRVVTMGDLRTLKDALVAIKKGEQVTQNINTALVTIGRVLDN